MSLEESKPSWWSGITATRPHGRRGVPHPLCSPLARWIEPRIKARLWDAFGAGRRRRRGGLWMVYVGHRRQQPVGVAIPAGVHRRWPAAIYADDTPARTQDCRRRIAIGAVAGGLRVRGRLAWLVLLNLSARLVAGLEREWCFQHLARDRWRRDPAAERLWFETAGVAEIFENTLTVQFNHRMRGDRLWPVAVLHASTWFARAATSRRAAAADDRLFRHHPGGSGSPRC